MYVVSAGIAALLSRWGRRGAIIERLRYARMSRLPAGSRMGCCRNHRNCRNCRSRRAYGRAYGLGRVGRGHLGEREGNVTFLERGKGRCYKNVKNETFRGTACLRARYAEVEGEVR